jgi:hypothetical protein
MRKQGILRSSLPALVLLLGASATAALAQNHQRENKNLEPLVIEREGSTDAGGGILTGADGSRFDYDYLYAYFQIPPKARKHSLVMWHGCLSKAWETRVDGGPGFQRLFVQKGWPVYVIDQPRISRGARGLGAYSFPAVTNGSDCGWNTFRYGLWVPPGARTFFPGVQLSQDPESVNRLCRYNGSPGGPSIGRNDADRAIPVGAVSSLIDKIGPTVLVTHSNSGQYGWLTRIKNAKVAGIVAYEPASFVYPSDALPAAVPTADAQVAAINQPIVVSPAEFQRLTTIPIQIIYGDNMQLTTPSPIFGVELWRVVWQRVHQFAAEVNRRGGNVTILHLPDLGVRGNSHFPFADLNNEKVADLMAQYLHEKRLDKRGGTDADD